MRLYAILAVALAACSPTTYTTGVPNLASVNANVWRSGQITTREGWEAIRKLANGRRVVVIKLNLEEEGSDYPGVGLGVISELHTLAIQPAGDRDVFDAARNTFRRPDQAVVDAAERLLDLAPGRVATHIYLVHCTHGQDRTGFVIGQHRVLHDGWTKQKAYAEMREHHFHPALHGVHDAWEAWRP